MLLCSPVQARTLAMRRPWAPEFEDESRQEPVGEEDRIEAEAPVPTATQELTARTGESEAEAETEEPAPVTATPEQQQLEIVLEDVEAVPDNPQLRRPTRIIVSNRTNDLSNNYKVISQDGVMVSRPIRIAESDQARAEAREARAEAERARRKAEEAGG